MGGEQDMRQLLRPKGGETNDFFDVRLVIRPGGEEETHGFFDGEL